MQKVDNWDDETDETCIVGMSVKTPVPFFWHSNSLCDFHPPNMVQYGAIGQEIHPQMSTKLGWEHVQTATWERTRITFFFREVTLPDTNLRRRLLQRPQVFCFSTSADEDQILQGTGSGSLSCKHHPVFLKLGSKQRNALTSLRIQPSQVNVSVKQSQFANWLDRQQSIIFVEFDSRRCPFS